MLEQCFAFKTTNDSLVLCNQLQDDLNLWMYDKDVISNELIHILRN